MSAAGWINPRGPFLPCTSVAVRGWHTQHSGYIKRRPSLTLFLDEAAFVPVALGSGVRSLYRTGGQCAGRGSITSGIASRRLTGIRESLEAAPGFEPGITVLQTAALPLGYAATREKQPAAGPGGPADRPIIGALAPGFKAKARAPRAGGPGRGKENGAGNGIRTRDIYLGKVELYH